MWRQAISKSEKGELGKVYYFNIVLVWPDGDEWTMAQPFTINTLAGKDIEKVLKDSPEIPQTMKAHLLSQRKAEATLSNGSFMKIIISESPAPKNWDRPKQKSNLIL